LHVDALDAVQHAVLANRGAVLARAEDFLNPLAVRIFRALLTRRNPPGRCNLRRLSTTEVLPTWPASSRVRGAASLFFHLWAESSSSKRGSGSRHRPRRRCRSRESRSGCPQNAVLKVHMAAQAHSARPITASSRAPAQSSGIETPHIIFSKHPFMAQKGQMPCVLRLA
jgi:hypothetical protein